ncbi:DNA replication complex gins protein PSF1 [Blastocystis sp. subtype 4]|uniref:DNA replication complex gins protein PSF1 n=1 Tax=Blastocystis sp. subtype 4 TaxID=944170 RepID=UPI0007118E51|nr:DNA replication complex gins protein PSF1 [Blastocystis sp. subtype 4]KNB44111.1 DNA replication complex gins protein PSF1 [Blastocystis sp. subtype 4]|eukprot:XP_014527549.1 DNA replication complex gins protein PSF1 [Blastocystis sp. subtype 4]
MAYSLSNKATDLLKELKRSEWIPKYNEDGINTVFDEMDRLMERILIMYDKMQTYTSELSEGNDAEEKEEIINGLNIMLNIHHCTFYHDKRCIYAYLKHRLTKIREYRWAVGQLNSEDVLSLMSKGEIKFYQDYDQLLGTYMQNSGFDLTANMFPPHSLYVEVVALQDYGEIVTASGPVNISLDRLGRVV